MSALLDRNACGADMRMYSVFEYTYLLWWNSFFTIAPVIAIGIFDRHAGKSCGQFVCLRLLTASLQMITP